MTFGLWLLLVSLAIWSLGLRLLVFRALSFFLPCLLLLGVLLALCLLTRLRWPSLLLALCPLPRLRLLSLLLTLLSLFRLLLLNFLLAFRLLTRLLLFRLLLTLLLLTRVRVAFARRFSCILARPYLLRIFPRFGCPVFATAI